MMVHPEFAMSGGGDKNHCCRGGIFFGWKIRGDGRTMNARHYVVALWADPDRLLGGLAFRTRRAVRPQKNRIRFNCTALMENPKITANSSDKRFFRARSVDTDNLLSDPSVIQTKDRSPGSRDRMLALNVFQAGSFTPQAAQVIELGPPHFRRTHQLNFIQHPRPLRQHTLHAFPKTTLTHL